MKVRDKFHAQNEEDFNLDDTAVQDEQLLKDRYVEVLKYFVPYPFLNWKTAQSDGEIQDTILHVHTTTLVIERRENSLRAYSSEC